MTGAKGSQRPKLIVMTSPSRSLTAFSSASIRPRSSGGMAAIIALKTSFSCRVLWNVLARIK